MPYPRSRFKYWLSVTLAGQADRLRSAPLRPSLHRRPACPLELQSRRLRSAPLRPRFARPSFCLYPPPTTLPLSPRSCIANISIRPRVWHIILPKTTAGKREIFLWIKNTQNFFLVLEMSFQFWRKKSSEIVSSSGDFFPILEKKIPRICF